MKFLQLVESKMRELDEADAAQQAPQAQPEDPNISPEQSALPSPEEVQDQQPMTPEGMVYLVDLARRALAFDPNQVGEFDKDVISNAVTPENAEKVLQDIQRIVGTA